MEIQDDTCFKRFKKKILAYGQFTFRAFIQIISVTFDVMKLIEVEASENLTLSIMINVAVFGPILNSVSTVLLPDVNIQ